MQQTLFHIPLPSTGLLMAVWAVASVGLLSWLVWRHGFTGELWGYAPIILIAAVAIWFVIPAVAEPEGLPIRGYGVMLLAGVAAGVWLAVRRAQQAGLAPDVIFSLAFWMFLAGIFGARLFYTIEYWRQFLLEPGEERMRPLGEIVGRVLNVTQGGLVVYGAAAGGGLAILFFVRKYRLPGLALADLVAPCMVLGLALGRVGCFLNGCCYGGPSDLAWPLAVTFPRGSPPQYGQAKAHQISLHGLQFPRDDTAPPDISAVEPGSAADKAGLKPGDRIVAILGKPVDPAQQAAEYDTVRIEPVRSVGEAMFSLLTINGDGSQITVRSAGDGAVRQVTLSGPPPANRPVHPAQLYAALDAFLLSLFLVAYYPYRRRDGEVLALMLTIHPISRYLLEVVRIDEADFIRFPSSWAATLGSGLSISQTISILILAAAAALWIYLLRQPRRTAFFLDSTAGPIAAAA